MEINDDDKKYIRKLISYIGVMMGMCALLLVFIIIEPFIKNIDVSSNTKIGTKNIANTTKDTVKYWIASDINVEPDTKLKNILAYGKDIIAHTSKYFGPKGSVQKMSNGLNCQNCHLQAGSAIFGNNYGSVASQYPKFRARSGSVENLYKRVNDCFQRSLNGKSLDSTGSEMQAITTYINYIGKDVKKGKKAAGSGFKDLAYLDRATDPLKGKNLYNAKCQSCHQLNGEGVFNDTKTEYIYPALWGKHSFNDAAGLYRISNFAKYIKYNMPQGASYAKPILSNEEAWDIAAYVNSQARPHMEVASDWPDKSKKPVDHPFGPYADNFSEKQHKYGPFKPIADHQKANSSDPNHKKK